MTRPDPFLLVQLSDPHVGADWEGRDPAAPLAAAVESIGRLRPAAGAVLVTGDITERGADAEYELARDLLAPLEAPLHVLPGNHDDRAALRRHFDVPGMGAEPVNYAADVGPLRLVVVDTTHPGEDPGVLDGDQLMWLDRQLAAAAEMPTILAMHHPPLRTAIPPLDRIGLAAADRRALGAVLERHPQVRRVVGGHLHRTLTSELAGRVVLSAPSTYLQARLDFSSDGLSVVAEPPGFAVHVLVNGELASHVQPVC